MDPISKLAQSLAVLRRQPAAGIQGTSGPAGKPADGAGKAVRRGGGASTASAGELRQRVVAGLAALPEAERGSLERQTAVFVEQALLHEWGAPFRQSPQFRQTVKRVARAMNGDPQVRCELLALLQELQAEAPKR